MDKLEEIFKLQEKFDNHIIETRNLHDITKEQWLQKQTLAMISELSELLDEINFKWWKNDKPLNDENIKGELVDIMHFFVAMCIKAGLSADELFNLYTGKNQENFDRQTGKSQKKGYELNK